MDLISLFCFWLHDDFHNQVIVIAILEGILILPAKLAFGGAQRQLDDMRFAITIQGAVCIIHDPVLRLKSKYQPGFAWKASHLKDLAYIALYGIKEHPALRLHEPETIVIRRILANKPGS